MKWPWQRRNDDVEDVSQRTQFAAGSKIKRGGAALYEAEAVELIQSLLGFMPEVDEILRKAGKGRTELRKVTGDDEIAGALETRLSALLAVPWRLDPYEEDPVAKELWELIEPHMEKLVRAAFGATPFGYSVFELVYAQGPRIGIAQVRDLPFEWFTVDNDGRLRYRKHGSSLLGEPVDEVYKFFLTARNPTVRQPTGDPLLSKLFWPWFFRSNGWKFWATFLERHGSPFTLGKTGGNVQVMADNLVKMVQSGVAAVGKDDDVQAISPGNAGDAFDKFSTAVDKRIQKVVLGQTLTTDVQGGGSFAAAKVQNFVREDRTLADVRMVLPTLQRVVNALCWLNFPGATPPSITMEAGEGLALERAKRDAILKNAGVRFARSYWLDHYDFEETDLLEGEAVPLDLTPDDEPPDPDDDSPEGRAKADRFAAAMALRGLALRPYAFAGARGRRFTADQEDLEQLIGSTLAQLPPPVSSAALRATIKASTGPADLVDRLGQLFANADSRTMRELTERALFAADVMGYAASEDAAGAPDPA
jgi:phage gp29-like protein